MRHCMVMVVNLLLIFKSPLASGRYSRRLNPIHSQRFIGFVVYSHVILDWG